MIEINNWIDTIWTKKGLKATLREFEVKEENIQKILNDKELSEINRKEISILSNIYNSIETVKHLLTQNNYLVFTNVTNKGDVARQAWKEYDYWLEIPQNLEAFVDWDKLGEELFEDNKFVYDWNMKMALMFFE